MAKEHKKLKKRYILLAAAVLIVGALLTAALALRFGNGTEGALAVVPSETMYVLLVLLLMLPVALVALFAVYLVRRRRMKSAPPVTIRAVVGESAPAPARVQTQESASAPVAAAEEGAKSRYEGLTALDAEKESFLRSDYDEHINLKTLCERFRNYAAGKLRLYYSAADIRRFVAGLLVSHIMILQGMSGTGKTSLARAFGEFLDNPSLIVPVQPMWKERTDLVGYYNEFTRRFNETDLLKKMYEANYSKDIFITVLDEMNIARVEYYFAEFLSLLELPNPEERNLVVANGSWEDDPEQLDKGHLRLPANMWFIGTANNDDSTFAISDKVYDRAMIMDLDTKAESFYAESGGRVHLTAKRFAELGEAAQREYEITRRNLGRLQKLDEYMKENFRITFGNRIMKQIRTYVPVYIACGGEELEALDDILAKKVMRKLGMQNPVYIRNQADKFCRYMDELFGEDGLKECKAVVQRLKLNA